MLWEPDLCASLVSGGACWGQFTFRCAFPGGLQTVALLRVPGLGFGGFGGLQTGFGASRDLGFSGFRARVFANWGLLCKSRGGARGGVADRGFGFFLQIGGCNSGGGGGRGCKLGASAILGLETRRLLDLWSRTGLRTLT